VNGTVRNFDPVSWSLGKPPNPASPKPNRRWRPPGIDQDTCDDERERKRLVRIAGD